MAQRGRSWGVVSVAVLALCSACQRDVNVERAALQTEARALSARHIALEEEMAAWSESVGRWIQDNGVTSDPARVVLSLSSRSFLLHEAQQDGAASGDPAYSQLEHQLKNILAERNALDADWLNLLSRTRAANGRAGIKSTTHQQTFDFDFGDPTIPIPGVSARATCCKLTLDLPQLGTTCRFVKESCRKEQKKWVRVCEYECDPIVLTLD